MAACQDPLRRRVEQGNSLSAVRLRRPMSPSRKAVYPRALWAVRKSVGLAVRCASRTSCAPTSRAVDSAPRVGWNQCKPTNVRQIWRGLANLYAQRPRPGMGLLYLRGRWALDGRQSHPQGHHQGELLLRAGRRLGQRGQQRHSLGEERDDFGVGMPLGGVVRRLCQVLHGPPE